MKYNEFRRHLGKAGLSVYEYAALLGIRPNSVSHYAKQGEISRAHSLIAILLGDARDRGVNIQDIFKRYGIQSTLPSGGVSAVTQMEDYRRRYNRHKSPV